MGRRTPRRGKRPPSGASVETDGDTVDAAFSGYIGNTKAVSWFKEMIRERLRLGSPKLPFNFLLSGPKGVGKTELGERIARALHGIPFVPLDGPAVTGPAFIISEMDSSLKSHAQKPRKAGRKGPAEVLEYPPILVFVDEAQAIPTPIQDSLLRLLEPDTREVTLTDGRRRTIRMPDATFIFATNQPGKLQPAFRSRFLEVPLPYHSKAEIVAILKTRFPTWSDQVLGEIAQCNRLDLRKSIAFANVLQRQSGDGTSGSPTSASVRLQRESLVLDSNGLTAIERDILARVSSQPASEDSLRSSVGGDDPDRISTECIPYLMHLGYVVAQASGLLEATPAGRAYITSGQESAKEGGPHFGIFETGSEPLPRVLEVIRRRATDRIGAARERCQQSPQSLPYIPMHCVRTVGGKSSTKDLDATLDEWLEDPETNFAILFAPFGSGKSLAVIRLVERILKRPDDTSPRTPIFFDYPELALHTADSETFLRFCLARAYACDSSEVPEVLLDGQAWSRLVIVIDAFDEAYGQPSPDLRQLAPLIAKEGKLLVACRRSLENETDDELIRQLRDEVALRQFSVRQSMIAKILPFDLETLRHILPDLPDGRGHALLAYLASPRFRGADYLLRPLILQMLVELDLEKLARNQPPSIWDLYESYSQRVLSKDYNFNQSSIPGSIKEEVLTNLASDFFSATNLDRDSVETLSADQIGIRVMEAVINPDRPTLAKLDQVEWLRDFIRTNHIIVPVPERATGAKRYGFSHHTFYEYFLAKYFITRISHTESLGLKEEQTGAKSAIFDSLVPYFLRYGTQNRYQRELFRLAERESLSNPDRLIVTFILEDEPERVLKNASPDYLAFLLRQEKVVSSLFLWKAIEYQLILAANDQRRALDYVDAMKRKESSLDLELEERTLGTTSSPEEFLIARLRNPQLRAVKPITIFRLGLFGGPKALLVLGREEAQASGELRKLIARAIRQISTRVRAGSSRRSRR